MKLEQFEQVLEVAKTGTFSKAAKNLYMSQPNLSLSIKQFIIVHLFFRRSLSQNKGRYHRKRTDQDPPMAHVGES